MLGPEHLSRRGCTNECSEPTAILGLGLVGEEGTQVELQVMEGAGGG